LSIRYLFFNTYKIHSSFFFNHILWISYVFSKCNGTMLKHWVKEHFIICLNEYLRPTQTVLLITVYKYYVSNTKCVHSRWPGVSKTTYNSDPPNTRRMSTLNLIIIIIIHIIAADILIVSTWPYSLPYIIYSRVCV